MSGIIYKILKEAYFGIPVSVIEEGEDIESVKNVNLEEILKEIKLLERSNLDNELPASIIKK